ncbi:MAG: SusC/RagA family TonB-linked outer membrane protein, partial [Tannerella sp.]|nr:SusC/RagA family TonB-linked outer membrane protein [Tannerella sp.]
MRKNEFKLLIRTGNSMIFLFFMVVVLAVPRDLRAQGKILVSGRVTDTMGEILPGVSVTEKGTTNGTATDVNGRYELTVPVDAVVVFSMVGFEMQEHRGASLRQTPNIILSDRVAEIDEVVVVGYSTQKKTSLTGSVSSIKTSELIATKNENIANMLSGKMAGVRVVQSSGEPGTFASSVQIRGFGAPLYIIDGVPRTNMSRLDPNEIESISVLKDASAAIYGVRASNGVVLITTKKGIKGKPVIEFSSYYGVQTPINTPKGLDAVQFMEITNENNIMRGSVPPGTLVYSEELIDQYRSGQRTGTEWYRINSDFYAPQYQINTQVTGGGDMVDYFVNFSYLNQEGLYKSGDINYERFNIRNNLSVNFANGLRGEFNIGAMMETRNRPFVDAYNFWEAAWTYTPVSPAYANYDPLYIQNTDKGLNPLAITNSDIVGYKQDNMKLIQTTGSLIWDIPWVKKLQAKASYSYDYHMWDYKGLQKPYYLYEYDLNRDIYIPYLYGDPAAGNASAINRSTRNGKNTLLQFSLNYDRTFGGHNMGVLVLYEEGTTDNDNFFASGYINMTSIEELLGATNESLKGGMDGSKYAMGGDGSPQNGFWEVANKAFVGRVKYNFKERYYTEFAWRYDGSSKFAPGHQWGFFPSVSGAWRISEEPFLKNNRVFSFINNLKLRASYGVSGDDVTATFQFVPGYTYPGGHTDWWPVFYDGVPRETIRQRPTPNTKLTWYKSKTHNIGIDADFWNGLLGLEFDLFQRNREGLMATRTGTIPDWIGESFAQENLNSDRTRGFDFVLKHRNQIAREFDYGISGNLSFTRRMYKYVTRVPSDNRYADWRNNMTNRWADIWWGYGSSGQFRDYEEIWSHAKYITNNTGNSELKPGDYKYEDWNEDGVIDDKDVHPIMGGNYGEQSTPGITYGMMVDARYKGFDFNMVFQGGALG